MRLILSFVSFSSPDSRLTFRQNWGEAVAAHISSRISSLFKLGVGGSHSQVSTFLGKSLSRSDNFLTGIVPDYH